MSKDNGTYIKLFRKITDWEWYTDIPTCKLFIHILLKASVTGKRYRGQDIPMGAFTTSIEILASETGLSPQNVRTALKKLKSTGEITCQVTNKFTQIMVIKWGDYQSYADVTNKQNNKQITINQQSTNNQLTTIKECKDSKNIKKEKIYKKEKSEKHKHGEYQNVLLTDEEYNKLHQEYSNAKDLITYLDEYIEMKGYKAKSHYLAIKKWVVDAEQRNKPKEKQVEKLEIYDSSKNREITEEELKAFEELRGNT